MLTLSSVNAQAFELVFEAHSAQLFSQPHDITLSADKRLLYVADNGNDRIAVLDATSLGLLGSFAEGEVSEPHDVVFDADGQLLVADTGNSRIAVYEVSAFKGKLVTEYRGGFSRPEGVAVHPDGRIYVTGAGSNNVVVFKDGKIITKADGLSSPHDIVVAKDGSVWIADAGNDRLVHMSDTLKTLDVVQGQPFNFDGPRYLDFDNKGRLYVADKYANKIKVLTPDNKPFYTLGNDRSGMGPGLFNRPEGVVIHNHLVWFSDTYNNRIVRYRIVE
ncbi:MAG TPA: NHL repeat-containing protein [Gammaproteobacteria bacterium]